MTKASIMAAAAEFIKANAMDKAKYTQEAHCAFLMKIICKDAGIEDKAIKLAILESLGANGLGGNHSQFKQKLFGESEKVAEAGADPLAKYKLD